jgi:zinc transport system permease protein
MGIFLADVFRYEFLQHALAAGVLAGVACGIVGTWVVARRITYLAGGIAHTVLGGVGVARYLQKVHGLDWLDPLYGALAAAVGSALLIGWVSLKAREREDTLISAMLAVGMAVGLVFITRTPGYGEDLMSYLFGNILLVGKSDLWLLAGLDAAVLLVVIGYYNRLAAVSFDPQFAGLRGVNTAFFHLLLLCVVALSVVLLISVVGIVLVIALLAIPAAIAGRFTRRLWSMMVLASVLGVVFTTGGLAVSYAPGLPAGATTILLAAGAYLLFQLPAVIRGRTNRGQ